MASTDGMSVDSRSADEGGTGLYAYYPASILVVNQIQDVGCLRRRHRLPPYIGSRICEVTVGFNYSEAK